MAAIRKSRMFSASGNSILPSGTSRPSIQRIIDIDVAQKSPVSLRHGCSAYSGRVPDVSKSNATTFVLSHCNLQTLRSQSAHKVYQVYFLPDGPSMLYLA